MLLQISGTIVVSALMLASSGGAANLGYIFAVFCRPIWDSRQKSQQSLKKAFKNYSNWKGGCLFYTERLKKPTCSDIVKL